MTGTVPRIDLTPALRVSRVVTGLWQVADLERLGQDTSAEQRAAALEPYVAAGFTSFDVADHYGSAELVTGAFRRAHPDQAIEVATKWVPEPGDLTRSQVVEAVDRARERLGVERIDLLQFHAWRFSHPSWLAALFWLAELREQGAIGAIGLTNVDTAHLRVAVESGIPIATNQVCYSLLDGRPARSMAEYCRHRDVHLLAYGTLAGGFFSERWLGQPAPSVESLPTWSLMKYRRFIDAAGGWDRFQGLLHAVAEVATRLGTTIPAVACRWVLDQPAVAAIIVGARLGHREHLAATRAALALSLDDEARTALDQAIGRLDRIPGDSGDEYRRPPFLTASGDLSHHLERFPPPYQARTGADGLERLWTGTSSETLAGYCRAVRQGNRILVSGTTASHGDRLIGGGDPEAQTHAAIDKLEGTLESFGSSLADVIRTRVYVARPDDWLAVSAALGARFRGIDPANTLVGASLVGDDFLVEIEAEALARGKDRG